MAEVLEAGGRRSEASGCSRSRLASHPDATDVRTELQQIASGAGAREVARR